MSRLLRHTAGERGLTMSADGWAAIADVLRLLDLTREQLDKAVLENDKQRLQVDGGADPGVSGAFARRDAGDT